MSTTNSPNSDSTGTIPVDEAKQGVENWQVYLGDNPDQKFVVRSYELPIISFQNLLGNNPDAEAVRIYIGLVDAADPSSSQIYMVPIVNGHEKLFRLTPPSGPPTGGDDNSNVYDMAKACPPNCGNGGGWPDTLG